MGIEMVLVLVVVVVVFVVVVLVDVVVVVGGNEHRTQHVAPRIQRVQRAFNGPPLHVHVNHHARRVRLRVQPCTVLASPVGRRPDWTQSTGSRLSRERGTCYAASRIAYYSLNLYPTK